MASNYKVAGTDLDSIFAPLNGFSPTSDTGFKVNGVDLSQRYFPSGGGDQIAFDTRYLKNGTTDLRFIFRINGFNTISITFSGPSDVLKGGVGGGTWTYTASTFGGAQLTQVRFYIFGHGGAFTPVSGDFYSGSVDWGNPFGSPNIANTDGDYLAIFEADDDQGGHAGDVIPFTVSDP